MRKLVALLLAAFAAPAIAAEYRYYRLTTLTSYNFAESDYSLNAAAASEFRLSLGGSPMDSTGHSVTASTTDDDAPASNLLDSDTETFWSSDTYPVEIDHPHTLIYDATAPTEIDRILLSNRSGLQWGSIGGYEIHGSDDASSWTLLASGTANTGSPVAEETITLMVDSASSLLLRRRR
jgi:hypothetical protein